jgi:hypothetical protein
VVTALRGWNYRREQFVYVVLAFFTCGKDSCCLSWQCTLGVAHSIDTRMNALQELCTLDAILKDCDYERRLALEIFNPRIGSMVEKSLNSLSIVELGSDMQHCFTFRVLLVHKSVVSGSQEFSEYLAVMWGNGEVKSRVSRCIRPLR